MAKQIYSTLSADTRYAEWVTTPGLNTIQKSVLVCGGAGVALRGAGQRVITPSGVRTEVSDADADFLQNNGHFKEHMKRGFVRIENVARDPEKVADKMETDEGGAPKTPDDVKKAAADAASKTGLAPDESLAVVTGGKKK